MKLIQIDNRTYINPEQLMYIQASLADDTTIIAMADGQTYYSDKDIDELAAIISEAWRQK